MVKKLNKKIMAMVLCGVVGVMSCMPVLAAEDTTGNARAYGCDACGQGTVITYVEADAWRSSYVTCQYVSYELDELKTRNVHYREVCNACGVTYEYTVTETERVCNH